jgi:superfamily I DNA and/or RNA helicase
LLTASSDYTVDKLSEFLLDEGINLLRFGYPINSDQQLINSTFAELIVKQDSYLKAQQLRKDLSKKYLTDQPNFNLETNLNILNQEDKKIIEQVKDLEKKAAQEILTEADVICTTNFAVGSKFLTDLNFDLSIIEEANQAIQPAALLAFLKAKKTILLGDQKELLPDIISKEAAKQGLASSLFDRLTNLYAENCLVKFKHQYRMNRKLMGFASLYFYDNQLRADESAAKITLADLDIKTSTDNAFTVQAMQANYPFVFLDTSEMKAAEHCLHENGLYYNPVEAEIILDLINQAVKSNLSAADIGVITPYLAQINLINQHNKFAQVEINQAAAFQGREKELIIYSAVRSNQSANLGLLKNLNQLNLALTRARRKIIFVGDSKTICQEEVYANLLIYTKKIGLYYKL